MNKVILESYLCCEENKVDGVTESHCQAAAPLGQVSGSLSEEMALSWLRPQGKWWNDEKEQGVQSF